MSRLSSAIRTLVWECWRMSRQEIWLASCSAFVIFLLYLNIRPNLDSEQQNVAAFFLSMILATLSAISFAWIQGFNGQYAFSFSRHFTKPISTRLLVLTPLLTIVAKSFFTSLILLILFQWFSETTLAAFPVSLGVAIVTGLLVCISWATSSLKWRLGLAFTIIGLAMLILVAYAKSLAESESSSFLITWAVIKWSFYLLGGLAFVSALPLVITSVAQQRSFEGPRFAAQPQFEERNIQYGGMRLTNQFSSPFSAMVWFELKTLGKRIAFWACVTYSIFGLFMLAGSIINQNSGIEAYTGYFTSFSVLTCLLFGFFGSIVLLGTAPMPLFQTAKPVSDQEFAFSKLCSILIHLAMGFVISAIFVVGFSGLQYFLGHGLNQDTVHRESEWLHLMREQLGWRWSWLPVVLFLVVVVNVGVASFAWIAMTHLWRWRMMLLLIAGLSLLADRAYGTPDLPDANFPSWLGFAYVSVLAATSFWLAWISVSLKRIEMPMIALILGFWLLGLVLLIVFANITYPEWRQRISIDIFVLIAITSWIPAGLAIALPGIFSRLRHQA